MSDAPVLRLLQRNDGRGAQGHARLIGPGLPNGATSTQASTSPRIGTTGRYS